LDIIFICFSPLKIFTVNGAGHAWVNGVYTPSNYFDDVPTWTMTRDVTITTPRITSMDKLKNIFIDNNNNNNNNNNNDTTTTTVTKKFTLFRVSMAQGKSRNWYLSEMDEEKPGTKADVDYYYAKSNSGNTNICFSFFAGFLGRGLD